MSERKTTTSRGWSAGDAGEDSTQKPTPKYSECQDTTKIKLQRFELLRVEELASAADVYLAYDRFLGRDVILRVWPAPRGDAERRMVWSYFEDIMYLSAPGVGRVYDLVTTEEEVVTVEERVSGVTLEEALSYGVLERRELMDLLIGVARTLAALHDGGRGHGRLDAHHVVVDNYGEARVVCPEPKVSSPATLESDVRAFGLLVLECFVGRSMAVDVLGRAGLVNLHQLDCLSSSCCRALVEVAERCVEQAPGFASATELWAALETSLGAPAHAPDARAFSTVVISRRTVSPWVWPGAAAAALALLLVFWPAPRNPADTAVPLPIAEQHAARGGSPETAQTMQPVVELHEQVLEAELVPRAPDLRRNLGPDVAALERRLLNAPRHKELLCQLGEAYVRAGNHVAGVGALRRCVRIGASEPDRRGRVLELLTSLEATEGLFEEQP